MPLRCYPCPRTGVTHVSRTNKTHAVQNTVSSAFITGAQQDLDQQFKTFTVYELTIKTGSQPQ